MQALLARWQQATSWLSPEILTIPLETVRAWMNESADLAVYRFALEEIFRLQEHVLDERGEQLLSLSSRLSGAPNEAYQALSVADAKFPTITLSTGQEVTLSYGQYRAVLATNRNQADRRAAFLGHYGTYSSSLNTYATLYHGICQRDWFHARARGYKTTLDAALHTNNIPRTVVDNLITEARAGAEPLRRYHRLRRRALKLIATTRTTSRSRSSIGNGVMPTPTSSRPSSRPSLRSVRPIRSGCGGGSANGG